MDKKYIPILIGFLITFSVLLFFMIIGITYYFGESIFSEETVLIFIPFIPGPIFSDILIILCLPIVIFVLYYILAPYMARFFIGLHRAFYRLIREDPSKYGVVQLSKRVTGRQLFTRSMVLSLFTFSIAVFLVDLGLGSSFLTYSSSLPIFDTIVQVFVACLCLGALTLLLFLPVWFLEDSGVTSFRVFISEDDARSPVDIQGVHALFSNVLLGYAGVATLLIWITFIVDALATVPVTDPGFLVVIFFIFLPVIVSGFFSIPIYLYERRVSQLINKFEPHLKKLNFEKIKPPKFEEVE